MAPEETPTPRIEEDPRPAREPIRIGHLALAKPADVPGPASGQGSIRCRMTGRMGGAEIYVIEYLPWLRSFRVEYMERGGMAVWLPQYEAGELSGENAQQEPERFIPEHVVLSWRRWLPPAPQPAVSDRRARVA